MSGMDAVYLHITPEMRQRLCDVLQDLWDQAIGERRKLAPQSAVALLNQVLSAHEACPWFDDMSGALPPDEAATDVLWLATLPADSREPYGELVQYREVLAFIPPTVG
jgi:hypothetical protein